MGGLPEILAMLGPFPRSGRTPETNHIEFQQVMILGILFVILNRRSRRVDFSGSATNKACLLA
jgi:hypothetical protein